MYQFMRYILYKLDEDEVFFLNVKLLFSEHLADNSLLCCCQASNTIVFTLHIFHLFFSTQYFLHMFLSRKSHWIVWVLYESCILYNNIQPSKTIELHFYCQIGWRQCYFDWLCLICVCFHCPTTTQIPKLIISQWIKWKYRNIVIGSSSHCNRVCLKSFQYDRLFYHRNCDP